MGIVEEYKGNISRASAISDEIYHIVNLIKKTKIFSKERRNYWKEIYKLQDELEETKVNIKNNKNELSSYSTFSSDLMLPLLVDHISNLEGEEYHIVKLKEEDYEEFFYPTGNAFDPPMLMLRQGSSYNIITTSSNKEKLEEMKPEKYLSNYLDSLDNNKYISLDDTKSITLLNGLELREEFSKYPYLKDFALILLKMRLENKNITNEEIKTKIKKR